MSYVKPSVLVYQELENAGGVLNSTPDLGAVIIGPLFNVVRVDPASAPSLTATLGKASTDVVADLEETIPSGPLGLKIALKNTYPGQNVVPSSVIVHASDLYVKTLEVALADVSTANTAFQNSFRSKYDFDFTNVGDVYNDATFTPASVVPSDLLPDSTAAHIKVGDKVVISAVVSAVTTTMTTTVSKIYTGLDSNGATVITGFSTADSFPNVVDGVNPVPATIKVYRFYDYLVVPSKINAVDQFDLDTADDDYIWAMDPVCAFEGPAPSQTFHEILSGKFHVSYKALRQDKYSTILTISSPDEREGELGEATEENPLGLGVKIALDNTVTSVMAVSLQKLGGTWPNVSYDWAGARELIENQKTAYALSPLTQEIAELLSFKAHVVQMSDPVNAAWRVLIANTKIPSVQYMLSDANADAPATTGTSSLTGGTLYFRDLTKNFITASVTPGDLVVVTASSAAGLIGTWTVDEIINGTTLKLEGFSALTNDAATITYYIVRNLTRAQRAASVAVTSAGFNSNRVWHVQPDTVGVEVNGQTKYLPGYYLCCGMAGMTAGFPVQQGFTNIAVAGITDLRNSNYYFTKEDLNTMAEAGTCLFVQDVQGGIPYCRHELTTDVTVLEYREIVKVKNWDFLSFYYYDKLKGFIGTWNITPDTLSNMKQTMIASSELLKAQKLPRIGAPLLNYQDPAVSQDPVNKDQVNIRLKIETVTPNNYTNLYLVI